MQKWIYLRCNCWFWIVFSPRIVVIVHDAVWIIGYIEVFSISLCVTIHLFTIFFKEIMFVTFLYVIPLDFNKFVSVCSWLGMVNAKSVNKFMLHCAEKAIFAIQKPCSRPLVWNDLLIVITPGEVFMKSQIVGVSIPCWQSNSWRTCLLFLGKNFCIVFVGRLLWPSREERGISRWAHQLLFGEMRH